MSGVDEMDRLYRNLCLQLGLDPDGWCPKVWVKANEDYQL